MESFNSIENVSFFSLFREEGYPTYYPIAYPFPNIDYTLTKILALFVCLWLIFLIISPGYSGRERWFYICRVTIFLAVPLTIIVCYYAPYWESDSIVTLVKTQFTSTSEIIAKIGLNIGLVGFNITLQEDTSLLRLTTSSLSTSTSSPSYQSTIDFNEQFRWDWASGYNNKRIKLNEETGYLKYQYQLSATKGLPIPFLWILDYFTIDGEDYRFARFYQRAGWFCHTFLWLSLGCWLLSCCLFCIVIEYGSLLMLLTGLSLITTNIIWALHSNPVPLEIPFRSPTGGKVVFLHPDYSWAYWINLTNGLFCLTLGIFIYILDLKYPDLTAQFFGIDIIQDYDQYLQEIDEEKRRLQGKQVEKFTSDELTTIQKKEDRNDSNYVALRKKISSNRMSKLHRLTLRDPNYLGRTPQKVINENGDQEMAEAYYVVPKTVTIPIQPRIVGSQGVEQFTISTQ